MENYPRSFQYKHWCVLLMLAVIPLSNSFGQLRKVIHQTFDLDSVAVLNFDLYGDYVVENWAGSNVLSETTIKLYQASDAVLNFFIESGRYELLADKSGTSLALKSKDKERKSIKTSRGETTEIVKMRIMVPESFQKSGEFSWVSMKADTTSNN